MRIHYIKTDNHRYAIVDEFNNLIDNAQGYGYKSADAAWNYAFQQAQSNNPNFTHLLQANGKAEFMPQSSDSRSTGLF